MNAGKQRFSRGVRENIQACMLPGRSAGRLTAAAAFLTYLYIQLYVIGALAGSAEADAPREEVPLDTSGTLSALVLGPANDLDAAHDRWQAWKAGHGLPVTMGAFHWFHVNNGGPNATGYGIPGLEGTYFYYVQLDPQFTPAPGPVRGVGAHVDFRFRDSADPLRPFYDHTYWFYELYGWIDTDVGRFKAGQIWRRFGLDWDGSWWGDVQFFDGFKFNPDYGLSWEQRWDISDRVQLDSFVQYFAAQDGISSALAGGNPESVPGADARNTGIIRLVPRWNFSGSSSLALGVSALAGENHGITPQGGNDAQTAVGVDLTFTQDQFAVFGEALRSYGIVNPRRYVTGGPSDRISELLFGGSYRLGPVLFRVAWSAGFDENPAGRQYMWVPGVTLAITKNLDLYAEYVRWDVIPDGGPRFIFEDGAQLILNWHL